MNRARAITFSSAIVLSGLAAPIAGQGQRTIGDALQRRDVLQPAAPLRPIDQRVEDVGLLNQSLRIVSDGLDQGNSFDYVYRLPGSGDFMRVQGAIHAVFPQSSYSLTRNGGINTNIPAGTEFFIGSPTDRNTPGVASGADQPGVYTTLPPEAQELRWNTRILPLGHGATALQAGFQSNQDERAYDDRSFSAESEPTGAPSERGAAPFGARSSDGPSPALERSVRDSEAQRRDVARGPADEVLPTLRADAAYRHERLRDLLYRAAAEAHQHAGR